MSVNSNFIHTSFEATNVNDIFKTPFKVPEGYTLNHGRSNCDLVSQKTKKLQSQYEQLRITDTTDIDPPISVIKIGNSLLGTQGNISTISGPSKSGKSALTAMFIAGAINQSGKLEDLGLLDVLNNINGKAVIHIDTEQARHKQQANVRTIIKRSGHEICPDFYLSYNIRQLNLNEYKGVTEGICREASETFNGIHLIVIDGIADYIQDVNSPTDSKEIVKFFMDLAEKYKTHIIVIVHTNPGSDKERGHLGSECQRKSESVITVKCADGISFIEPKFLREAGKEDLPRIQFAYDKEKGYHVCCGVKNKTEEEKGEERSDFISELTDKVFVPPAAFVYKNAIKKIEEVSGRAEATAKGYFRDMRSFKYIIKDDEGKWRKNMSLFQIEA